MGIIHHHTGVYYTSPYICVFSILIIQYYFKKSITKTKLVIHTRSIPKNNTTIHIGLLIYRFVFKS